LIKEEYEIPLTASCGGLSADHGQKREPSGVTITRGDLTSPGPLQKGVYSLTRSHTLKARFMFAPPLGPDY